ncbi:MAG: T9SS type A sorting domain-containing protein [Bacteroidales bacterium]|nr:T9SS type A sorting domain-containing protein [Bacteroidales bacterium]
MKKIIISLIVIFLMTNAIAQTRTDSLHIAHYDLTLSITNFTSKEIKGKAILSVVSKVNTLNHIDLDLEDLITDSVLVDNQSLPFTQNGLLLTIALTTPMAQGDTLPITIYYHGKPASGIGNFGGFTFSGEYCYNLGASIKDIPHCFGRAWYPCLDFFTDKATYTMHVETTNDKMAVCGGLLTNVTVTENDNRIWEWEIHQPIPTYLSSVAVGEYKQYSDTVHIQNGIIPIDIYYYPEQEDIIANSFSNLKTAIHTYEQQYGPYLWDRVGYVIVNFKYGAMEHAMNIAYPYYAVTGNTQYESLYMHELSHFWFGDLITCERAEEMWINEGFAEFSPSLVFEKLYPSDNIYEDGYKNFVRERIVTALTKAHLNDNGYFALDSVPQSVTYGTHSYEKGAAVVHTLRHYLGDSLFSYALSSLLDQYQFQNVNSKQLFDHLSEVTHQDLTPFYEAWVHQPGFLHFSIDSIVSTGSTHLVYVRQRLHHAQHFGNDNRIEITLFAKNDKQKTVTFQFSGEYGVAEIEFDEKPLFGVIDFNEKMADAVIDRNFTINDKGSLPCEDAGFALLVSSIGSEPLFLRAEHNFVAPDGLKNANHNIYQLSDEHYWRVVFDETQDTLFTGNFSFKYDASNDKSIDYKLYETENSFNHLVLLYRKSPAEDWQITHSTKYGTKNGMIRTNELRAGEYCLGIGNPQAANISESTMPFRIYPTPADQNITIESDGDSYHLIFYNSLGTRISTTNISGSKNIISTENLPNGHYVLTIFKGEKWVKSIKLIVKH